MENLNIENSNQIIDENTALCSPYGNFSFLDSRKLENIYQKMHQCGKNYVEFVNKYSSQLKSVPEYCNNRVCSNSGCKEHRGYLYKRNHREQILFLKDNIRSPKAWIFTGWVIPIENISRKLLQDKLKKLYRLLNNFSTSAYSIHMEIKLYPYNHQNYGKAYIHFHVVTGGISNLKLIRRIWNRQVKYEKALCYENLSKYISKYASKVPIMETDLDLQFYHLLVYKTQMHRFSVRRGDLTPLYQESDFIPIELLEREIYYIYKRDEEKNKHYHPFCESYRKRGKPPPKNLTDFGLEEN